MDLQGIFSSDYNTSKLDGVPCKHCGEIPHIYFEKSPRSGKAFMNRSSRIDCDVSTGDEPTLLETFHKICWWKELDKYDYAQHTI